jgi:uncharacterized membrane protein YbhN (UPF0104 family)
MAADDSRRGADPRAAPTWRWPVSAVVVALMGAIGVQVFRSYEDASVSRLSASVLAVTVFVQFLSQLFFNEALLLPLRPHLKNLRFWEFFIVRTGGTFLGQLIPVAGSIGVRLAYLRRQGLAYSDFTRATVLTNVAAFAAAAALTAVATGALWMMTGTAPALVLGLSAGGVLLSVAAWVGFDRLPRLAASRLQAWPWLSALGGDRESRRMMLGTFGLSLARHGLNFVTFGLLYGALSGSSGAFLTGGLVYAVTSPVRMVNITPGNLGVNEWVVAIAGRGVAFDVTTGLVVALLFRAVTFVAQGAGVLVGSAWLAYRSPA